MTRKFTTDHLAFVTGDTAKTVDFYTDVMGWPLVGAHRGKEPDGRWFFISAFQADGFLLEFEEVEGRAGPAPQADGFPHLGLDVGTDEEYERWKAHFESCGVPYLETSEHNCWITDPNGVSFQLILKERSFTARDRRAEAQELLDTWLAEH